VGRCLDDAAPRAFVGVLAAHAARAVGGWARDSIETLVTVGGPALFGGLTLDAVRRAGNPTTVGHDDEAPFAPCPTAPDETAAILFTSGSTGTPKGVVYTHGNFAAQIDALRVLARIEPGEIDLATFPLFALFDPALGMTTVFADMDPSCPAAADPAKIVRAIQSHGVTTMFASPAILGKVARYGARRRDAGMPSLRRVVSAGAAVPLETIDHFLALAPRARVVTPYGATEALPVTAIDSDELGSADVRARIRRGDGVCVGRPAPGMKVTIVPIADGELSRDTALPLPQGAIGEIVAEGPVVTRAYFGAPHATRLAKIGRAHRMGDVGFLDDQGRLWFCGRKAQRVVTAAGTLFTEPCELVFQRHPEVFRAALVGVPSEPGGAFVRPVLCIELERGVSARHHARITRELAALAATAEHTRSITRFLFHPSFPVDPRHNAKIRREDLAVWAMRQVHA
jgi:acyl-CoA synthetase (AMP-forming)/AMP-acid ligase II